MIKRWHYQPLFVKVQTPILTRKDARTSLGLYLLDCVIKVSQTWKAWENL